MSSPAPDLVSSIPEWTLGWRLQRALAHGDVRAEEMAQELGVVRATISRWMHDRGAAPRAAYVKQWALRTGVPYEWLKDGDHGNGPDGSGGMADTGTYTARCHGPSRALTVVSPLVTVPHIPYRDVAEGNGSRIAAARPYSTGTTRWDEAEGSNLACAA